MPKIKEGFKGERAITLPDFFIKTIKSSSLGQLLYITDIGYYPHANFHYRKREAEEATEYILIYCVEGDGWATINDLYYTISANQFIILPINNKHSYGSNKKNPWTIYWIHFNGSKADYFSQGFNRPTNIIPQEDSRIKERLTLFEEIYSSMNYGYNINYIQYAISCFFHFLGSMKFIGEYRNNGIIKKNKDLTYKAIHFMQENLAKKICLSDIAKEVKLSVSYFSNMFEEKTGSSPLRYLTYLRVQEACRYLDFTDLKINQISPLVGYNDPLYFSRIFTKTMGVSPTAYKNKQKG